MRPPYLTFMVFIAVCAPAFALIQTSAVADTVTHTTQVTGTVESGQVGNDVSASDSKPGQNNSVTYSTQRLDDQGFGLRYAGPVETIGGSGKAIALVFNGPFARQGNFSDYILVIDSKGNHVPGHWHLAQKPAVVYFPVTHAGSYRVILTPGLRDRDGQILRQRYRGEVHVK